MTNKIFCITLAFLAYACMLSAWTRPAPQQACQARQLDAEACCPKDVCKKLVKSFEYPHDSVRTKVWWFHGETVTTKEGIDADLKAFKEKGIGGVVFYDQVHGKAAGAYPSMSAMWWQMLKYAAKRARQLGLSFEVAASNGYVAGGPWITEDLGMQQLVMADTLLTVADKKQITINLGCPAKGYHDIATLLFPDSMQYQDIWLLHGSRKVTDNKELILVYDAGKNIDISTISYGCRPRGKGSMGSMNIPGKPQERYFGAGYVDMPPIGDLEYSHDGKAWTSATRLQGIENVIGYKMKERTINFPKVSGRYFRVRLHDWLDPDSAFPQLEISNLRISGRDKINNWEVKSGMRTEVEYPHRDGSETGKINSRSIRNISDKVQAGGTVALTLEPGTWHIMRFGHAPTGARTKHGRANLQGLEADVMSAKAARMQYAHYFKAICDTLSAIGCKPEGMAMDSHEAGIANWTSGFEHAFAKLNGYDIVSRLPMLKGYIIDSREKTEKTLLDFRRTIAHLIRNEYYGTFERLCRQDGMTFTSQAMLNIDNDNIASRGVCDKPQGEFWAYQKNGNYDCLDAASAAHLYGHNVASAEAFTDTPYETSWQELLRIANLAYCRGINEFVVCASSYQPWLTHKYDDANSKHPYVFHRFHPNWKTVGPFWEYQARCSQMLQTGKPVVDLCVYIGEDPPQKTMAYKLPVIPEGYNFDVCTYHALATCLTAKHGELETERGMAYKALIVQDRTFLSDNAIKKIESFERAGIPVIWCNRGENVGEALAKRGIRPDLSFRSANLPNDKTCFYHRATEEADIYFVYNHSCHDYCEDVKLRTSCTHAEFWNPCTTERKDAALKQDKTVRLRLKPYESVFIVLTGKKHDKWHFMAGKRHLSKR